MSMSNAFCLTDLLHDFVDVTEQVFGSASPAADMGGFVHNYAAHGGIAAVPMACFTPQQVPVISALCSTFTCATQFHSSIPGC
jgi:phospholipase C